MNFKYFLTTKISKQLARGRLLAWQMWFQMYDFDVEWVPGNSNYLADALTREMNKAHVNRDIFDLPGKTPSDDSFETFVKRFQILDFVLNYVVKEIKKVVGVRLRRNQWILKNIILLFLSFYFILLFYYLFYFFIYLLYIFFFYCFLSFQFFNF